MADPEVPAEHPLDGIISSTRDREEVLKYLLTHGYDIYDGNIVNASNMQPAYNISSIAVTIKHFSVHRTPKTRINK